MMHSWFAEAARATETELLEQQKLVEGDPVAQAMLQKVPGLVGVLNEKRQLVGANHALLYACGVAPHDQWLGARHGELLQCEHAEELAGGCGTAECCATCGAAIAVVSSLCWDAGIERTCEIQSKQGCLPAVRRLSVRAEPIRFSGERFVLLFMRELS